MSDNAYSKLVEKMDSQNPGKYEPAVLKQMVNQMNDMARRSTMDIAKTGGVEAQRKAQEEFLTATANRYDNPSGSAQFSRDYLMAAAMFHKAVLSVTENIASNISTLVSSDQRNKDYHDIKAGRIGAEIHARAINNMILDTASSSALEKDSPRVADHNTMQMISLRDMANAVGRFCQGAGMKPDDLQMFIDAQQALSARSIAALSKISPAEARDLKISDAHTFDTLKAAITEYKAIQETTPPSGPSNKSPRI